MSDIILELKNISKSFGSNRALKNVNFDLRQGEIHCLMGENGAGKSTFINIITGVLQPDGGTILLNGEKVTFKNSIDAAKHGVVAIYQHPAAFPSMSVVENIFMSQEILSKVKSYNYREMKKRAREILNSLRSKIDITKSMSSLSVAEQQLVEIAKALSRNANILILDEPTASLSKYECEDLYKILEGLKKQGVSMIFITHRFEDMYRLADRVTVFRDASYIGTWPLKELTEPALIKAMVGREITTLYPKRNVKLGEEVLCVENLSKTGFYKDISFSVRKGEVLALTGLVGAGRTEVCQSIFGITKPDSGSIYLENQKIIVKNPRQALKYGIGLLPEDRQLYGLLLDLPIYQNSSSMNIKKFTNYGFLNTAMEISTSEKICNDLRLKALSVLANPSSLSGGNQQKVVFSKLLNRDLKVLILDEPTKGIDILAKYSIYEIINELAAKGYGIILISSEMSEVLGVSDRIVVMRSGHVSKEFVTPQTTQEMIMEASIKV